MRYLTDRKRAVGKGAGHSGTEHHWYMQVSAVALAFLLPVWVFIFGRALGQGHEAVLDTFARPFPAIVTGLVLFVSMRHFAKGAQMMIEKRQRLARIERWLGDGWPSRAIALAIARSLCMAD